MTANYSYFPILVEQEYPLSRDGLYKVLKENGVNARRYFYPLISDFPMYRVFHLLRARICLLLRKLQSRSYAYRFILILFWMINRVLLI